MKNLFLNVTLTVLVIFSVPAHAEYWQKILSCDNGAAVVNVDLDERRNLQLVISDSRVVRYLRYSSYSTDFPSDE